MTERDTTKFLAWSNELREVHNRLRKALRLVEESLETDNPTTAITIDLLLYCRGFCVALTQHHRGEDRRLFPAIEAEHPELAPVLRKLEQDHSWIDHLLGSLERAVELNATPEEIERHIEGISAIMESHFAYEERQLLTVLETLALDAKPRDVLGDLARE